MTQDEHLVPARAGRELDSPLAEIAQAKAYQKYGRTLTESHLRDYLFVILKRKWLIMTLVLVVTSLVTIQAYREPAIYEGKTTIRIEEKPQSVLPTGGIVINQSDPNFWGTQLNLLRSPSLARQVVLTLNLQNDPRFLGGQVQSSVFASLKRLFSGDKPVTAIAPATSSGEEPVGEEEMKEKSFSAEELVNLEPYEDAIGASLKVEPVKDTNLVTIQYVHTDPEMAQKIANTVADVFVQNNQERLHVGASKAEVTLLGEVAKYQTKVKDERVARFNYAKEHDLSLTSAGSNLEAQRASTYSSQLLEAENQRRNLQADYDSAKETDDALSNPEVQKDQLITSLRQKLTDLQEKREALLQIYTPEWPTVKQIDAQIKSTSDALRKAPEEILASMRKRYEAADKRQKSLAAAYARQHGITTQQIRYEIELASMTQDLSTDEQYLATLMQKLRELNSTGAERGTSVTVANYSRLPRAPVGPQRTRNIIVAFLLSLVAGIGLAFLLDFLDDTIKSLDDIDRYIHLPALALIPAARSEKARLRQGQPAGNSPGDAATALTMVDDARSPIAESYRHLRTSLLLSSAGQAPKTILVTSSQPSEGKTTTAINTAFMLAQTGAEVLIIDCDLRRPRLHTNFNLSNTRGLTNFLSGEVELDQVLHSYDKLPNLKLLPSGPIPPNPAELLGSEEMRRLLASLGERFAQIIVDSPPVISFTDASILSTVVDGVILVVHAGRSSRAVVRRAKQQLLDVGARIFGVVLNNVKVESHDYYYAGYYSEYYNSEGDDDAGAEESAKAASN